MKTLRGLFFGHHDIALLHDQEFDVVDLDLGARPFSEQHTVTDLEVDQDNPASFVAPTGADGYDFALAGFLLGGVGDDDAASGLVSIRLTTTRSCSGRIFIGVSLNPR